MLELLVRKPYQLRQTLLARNDTEYRMFGKREEHIDEDKRNLLRFLYNNKRLYFGDEARTPAHEIATFDELYKKLE